MVEGSERRRRASSRSRAFSARRCSMEVDQLLMLLAGPQRLGQPALADERVDDQHQRDEHEEHLQRAPARSREGRMRSTPETCVVDGATAASCTAEGIERQSFVQYFRPTAPPKLGFHQKKKRAYDRGVRDCADDPARRLRLPRFRTNARRGAAGRLRQPPAADGLGLPVGGAASSRTPSGRSSSRPRASASSRCGSASASCILTRRRNSSCSRSRTGATPICGG